MIGWTPPAFDPDGGLLLAALRGLNDAGVLSVFGGAAFRALILPPALRRRPPPRDRAAALDRAQRCWLGIGVASVAAAGVGWLLLQSGAMAGGSDLATAWAALPPVLEQTRFGHLILAQAVVLLLVAITLRRGAQRALPPALVLLLLDSLHGHAASMTGAARWMLPVGALHLLAGGIWLGGLVPLLLVVRIAPPKTAAAAAWSFSVWGKWCVLLVAGTAAIQAAVLVGSVQAAVGTAYGLVACAKLLLFGVLLGFACLNRYGLAPSLLRPATEAMARRRLLASIGLQSVAGLAVLLAAGLLADLPPGTRMDG